MRTMRQLGGLTIIGGLLFATWGCEDVDTGVEIPIASDLANKQREAKDNPLPSASKTGGFAMPDTGGSESDQSRAVAGQLQLTMPPDWQDAEMTAMQRSVLLAKFHVPDVHPDLEATVSTAGAGIDENFKRWQGQFTGADPKEETIDFDRSTASVLTLTGHFSPGFGKKNRDDWTMVGAAFPCRNGDVYLKVTGPADKMSEINDTLRKLIKSAKLIQ